MPSIRVELDKEIPARGLRDLRKMMQAVCDESPYTYRVKSVFIHQEVNSFGKH